MNIVETQAIENTNKATNVIDITIHTGAKNEQRGMTSSRSTCKPPSES
jgi:hypothetical protein